MGTLKGYQVTTNFNNDEFNILMTLMEDYFDNIEPEDLEDPSDRFAQDHERAKTLHHRLEVEGKQAGFYKE